MRTSLLSFLVSAALVASVGCGDDTSDGGGGGGTPSDGGGGNGTGGTPSTGGGGEGTGGDNTGGAGAMGPGYSCEAATGDPGTLSLETVTDQLAQIVDIKAPPGAPDRLFVVQQNGRIRIIDNGTLVEAPFLDVSGIIRAGGEEGLLGLAFHPDYAENGRFFIHYSAAADGDSTVAEYAVSADPLVAETEEVQFVFSYRTEEGNHNGGAVEFGNDGYLYISLGDGGRQHDTTDPNGAGEDPEGCDAQRLDTLLGKILRLDVDATPDASGYPAADGNPDGAKYYHVGFRNPWRMSFDACTGDLYIGDVGQNLWEEIDLATEDDGPLNFGWPMFEGTNVHANDCEDPPTEGLVDPIAEYPHPQGGPGSVTGGYVYRGSDSPSLRGWYFYADYNLGRLYMLRAVDGAVVDQPILTDIEPGVPTAFGIDGNGEVYLGHYSGTVYKIVAN